MNYTEAVAYIESTPKFTKKNGPENTRELLRRLGRPERKMKVIHVAGTNGKGSVCAFLSAILTDAGRHTGLFTSPHLVEITERFVIDGKQVSHEIFARAFTRVMSVIEEMMADGYAHPAYFETLFAVGLLIFEEAQVEYLVMETGLGGRLDATNLVEHPIACVITSISLDHMEYLGDTVAKIASEKAGIIKEGVPVIYDGRNPESAAVIEETAARMHAKTYRYEASMSQILGKTDKSIDFLLDSGYDERVRVTVPYPALYQVVNSSIALIALRVIEMERRPSRSDLPMDVRHESGISAAQAAASIAAARWPGRMETVMPGVILDGAHNADGVQELIRTMQSMQDASASYISGEHFDEASDEASRTGARRVTLLFSAVSDKEYEKMIQEICEGVQLSDVVVTQVGGARALSPDTIADAFRRYTDAPVTACADVREAFEMALSRRGDGILFCAGSLYLVGELKAILAE
ncbi:MAG: bifunctional folylpolyglutamate synthase/dihydrofolate synthase [Lachnospiraceae bacterium]|nr:bifunctional folylpolyglutamate synthase/dihydrofolate synthase [Lachnospiraceae bacterium]